ncbi:MAG: ribosome silencing factor [Bifidobacteriaceae bacterium]|nr:ribosome silencing factor [Bifidobacteriaceae bacterium]
MADAEALRLARQAALAADSIKATAVVALDVSPRLPLTDVFVLATGSSERHVDGIVDAVEERLARCGANPARREGRPGAHWVLLDYGTIVVHVMHGADREFYALDKLWKDCPELDLLGQTADLPGDLALATAAAE